MSWVTVDADYVLAAMPSDIRAKYDPWIVTYPDKSGRLAEIAAQVVSDFRSGLAANPNVEMEDGDDLVPARCVPHAVTIVMYHLALEMGTSVNMSAQTGFINAQTYLRGLYTSEAVVDREAVGGTPSYETGIARVPRMLIGA